MSKLETVDDVVDSAMSEFKQTPNDLGGVTVSPREPVKISIPMTVEGVACQIELVPAQQEEESVWFVNWMIDVDENDEENVRGSTNRFESRREAAAEAVCEIELAVAGHKKCCEILSDMLSFRVAITDGKIPELAEPKPEGDSLPSVDSPLSPEDELDELRDYRAATGVIANEITKRKSAVEDRKRALKQAKDALEEAQDALASRALEEQEGGRGMPLFDKTTANNQAVAPVGEPWRDFPIASLGLPSHIVEKLAANNPSLTTLGEQEDWVAELNRSGETNPLSCITGVGPKSIKQFEDAKEDYFEEHPREGEGPLTNEEKQ